MAETVSIKWLPEPEAHNYPAALSYLSLLFEERSAKTHVAKLRRTSTRTPSFRARSSRSAPS